MKKAMIAFLFALIVMLPASAQQSQKWSVITSRLVGYYTTGLPLPISIYVINKSGHLIGVAKTDGNYQDKRFFEIRNVIRNKHIFDKHDGLTKTSKALRLYLSDLGYAPSDLAANDKHVVLLVSWDTANIPCPWLAKATNKYKNMTWKSFKDIAVGDHDYRFVNLRINPGKVAVSCPKKK